MIDSFRCSLVYFLSLFPRVVGMKKNAIPYRLGRQRAASVRVLGAVLLCIAPMFLTPAYADGGFSFYLGVPGVVIVPDYPPPYDGDYDHRWHRDDDHRWHRDDEHRWHRDDEHRDWHGDD